MKKLLVLFALFTASQVWGKGPDLTEVRVNGVHPTQGVLGMQWVDFKRTRFERFSQRELKERLKSEAPPAVLGPEGVVWLLDHHHEFRALYDMGVDSAFVTIVADYSELTFAEFEKKMENLIYLGDPEGKTNFTIRTLPERVSEIKKNDPHRTLASWLRRAGGYTKTRDTHSEFMWANALRPVVSGQMIARNPEKALEIALEFAQSDEAKNLPGYINVFKHRPCQAVLKGELQP